MKHEKYIIIKDDNTDMVSSLKKIDKNIIKEAMKEHDANDIEELADVMEVIETITKLKNIKWEELRKIQNEKKNKKGSFNEKIYLEYVEEEKRNLKEEKELNKELRK